MITPGPSPFTLPKSGERTLIVRNSLNGSPVVQVGVSSRILTQPELLSTALALLQRYSGPSRAAVDYVANELKALVQQADERARLNAIAARNGLGTYAAATPEEQARIHKIDKHERALADRKPSVLELIRAKHPDYSVAPSHLDEQTQKSVASWFNRRDEGFRARGSDHDLVFVHEGDGRWVLEGGDPKHVYTGAELAAVGHWRKSS